MSFLDIYECSLLEKLLFRPLPSVTCCATVGLLRNAVIKYPRLQKDHMKTREECLDLQIQATFAHFGHLRDIFSVLKPSLMFSAFIVWNNDLLPPLASSFRPCYSLYKSSHALTRKKINVPNELKCLKADFLFVQREQQQNGPSQQQANVL